MSLSFVSYFESEPPSDNNIDQEAALDPLDDADEPDENGVEEEDGGNTDEVSV